jgi:hypothetical protein
MRAVVGGSGRRWRLESQAQANSQLRSRGGTDVRACARQRCRSQTLYIPSPSSFDSDDRRLPRSPREPSHEEDEKRMDKRRKTIVAVPVADSVHSFPFEL